MAQASTAVAPDDVLVEENKKEDEAPPATPEEAQAEENGEEQVVSIPRKTFFVDEEELEETERKTLLQRINDWASSGVVYLPKSVDIANKRVNIVYCFLEIVVLALTIWYFVQRPEQYSVSLTPDAQVTFCGSRCEPLPSRMDAMTDQDSSSYCGSLTYTNGADSYGPFECLRRCGHPNSTTHCLQPSELLRISGEEAFVPTSYRLTDTLQAVNGSCAMGYTLQSSVCVWQQDYFVPAIEKLAVSFNHQFVVYPVYNSLSFMERAPPLKAHSGAYKSQGWDVGLLSVLFSPSGAEVKRFQPGQGVTLTLEEILQAAYVEGADSIGLDSVYSRADAAVSSLPARLTGLAVTIDIWTTSSQTCEIHHTIQTEKPKEVQVEWSGPIACMSGHLRLNSCAPCAMRRMVQVHVDQRWAKQQEEQTLGALGMRVVNMNGVHVKFRQMGSFYFLEEQALLRNITVVLLWVQFPVLICYWFCMLFLGMLSGIYSAVLHQEVNVAEGLKGFSARLLTYSSAFMNLRGKSDNLKSDGVSKKCVSERLSKICENLEVEDTVLEQLSHVIFHSLKSFRKDNAPQTDVVTCQEFCAACSTNEPVQLDTLVKIFDKDRKLGCLENFFLDKTLGEVRRAAEAESDSAAQEEELDDSEEAHAEHSRVVQAYRDVQFMLKDLGRIEQLALKTAQDLDVNPNTLGLVGTSNHPGVAAPAGSVPPKLKRSVSEDSIGDEASMEKRDPRDIER
ncbi:Uncharacterized protein SCF082_LOCUS44518 [Durusdinium trenchii]|uniref:Uncharacterized protein n=1 Tax=Durusdinium trenchii TaxID=1381693 RepID=A0ABP0R2F5_9DINO